MRASDSKTTERARRLRADETDVERKLWARLRNRQLADCKFVRQEPIGPYFADFACRERKLVVELDGHQHADDIHDTKRDAFLIGEGYRVLRFWNNELNVNLAGVLDTIFSALDERSHLSPQAGGGRAGGEAAARVRGGGDLSTVAPHPVVLPHDSASPRRRGEAGALVADRAFRQPDLRGTLQTDVPLAPLSWFRAGGTAEVLFTPADEDDLAYFLAGCPDGVPIIAIGLGSNLLVRDGGVPGVVIRLGKAFAGIKVERDHRIRAGAAAADVKVARAAAEAGIDGLAFLRGIPGAVGGAIAMNAGAYGGEICDALVEARAVDRRGRARTLSRDDMGFAYRRCAAAEGLIFTDALFQGRPGEPAAILGAMNAITEARGATQPVNTRTGGSTFANPPSHKAWQLIDAAGCRGLRRGAAQVSELHCNFLVNHGGASAADIEELGDEVRRRVHEHSGVELHWEIRRIGVAIEGDEER